MTDLDGRRPDTFSADPLETLLLARLNLLFEKVLAEQVRQAVREELARGAGPAAPDRREWLTQPAAAALAGVSVSSVRAWQAAGRLSKGNRGRVKASELRALLAGSQAPSQAGAVDLKAARIAASLKGGR